MISTHFRFPQSLIDRLDSLAQERGIDRSRLVRQLLEAGLKGRPAPTTEPLSEQELLSILNERARCGHVAAARALLLRIEDGNPRERLVREFERMAADARERSS